MSAIVVKQFGGVSPGTLVLTGNKNPNVDYLNIIGVRAYSLQDTWYAGPNSINKGSLGWILTQIPWQSYRIFILDLIIKFKYILDQLRYLRFIMDLYKFLAKQIVYKL